MSDTPEARTGRVLVADDDPAIRKIVKDRLSALGHELEVAKDGRDALSKIESFEPDVVLLDLRMPELDGFGVLDGLAKGESRPEVIVITAHGTIETAVKAVQAGASDFITKPFEPAHLAHVVQRALGSRALRDRVARLETELSSKHTLVQGESEAMTKAATLAKRAAPTKSTVLLLGESGSGKEVLARFIHAHSDVREGPFVAVNCATLSGELLESELFGHEKGAFTGAVKSKEGRIEQATGGTLFLDEIAELPPPTQAKLLRVLQEREYERVGGTRTLKADVRVIAATHQDLQKAIAEGRFREDLYYRIHVVTIVVPPLRERRGDLSALLDYFLARHGRESGRGALSLTDDARDLLLGYDWPGNVRELSNVVERMAVLAESTTIHVDDLPEELREQTRSMRRPPLLTDPEPDEALGYHDAVLEAKRRILRGALDQTGGHQTNAAKLLGLTQPYMARLMKNLGLRR